MAAAGALLEELPRASAETSSAEAEASFHRLLGEDAAAPSAVAADDGPAAPRRSGLPSAGAPGPGERERAMGVRRMIAGTSTMKAGMETVTLGVPMLVLQGLGGASLVAAFMVAYGVAQAVFSGAAGGLIARSSPQKVLAGAVAAQAALVAAVIGLGASHMLAAATLLPLYVLIGGAAGIAETARQSIPARLLGRDEAALSRYNARLHIFYEVAGVAGALAAGALMATVGPLWALALQPPAYLLGAWFFARVRAPVEDGVERPIASPAPPRPREMIAEYLADVKAGAKLILGDARLRWLAAAFVLPQITHRVLESLLVPVYAKTILKNGSYSAYMLTAANLGELIGAALLLRLAAKVPAPVWVRQGALGLALVWALAFTRDLPLVLAAIVACNAAWSSSDLSLRSDLQSKLSEKDLPRATSFLYGAFVLGAAAVSLAMGAFFDMLAPAHALLWLCGLFTAIGAAVFVASRRLRAPR